MFATVGFAAISEGHDQIIEQLTLIAFDREQVMRISGQNLAGEMALGQQGVGGQCFAGQIDFEGLDQGQERPDFIGLLGRVVVDALQLADFFWAKVVPL